MAMTMAGSGIPAKGAGKGVRQPNWTPEQAKEMSKRAGFMRAKMAAWRKANPDAPLTMMERDRLIREGLREATPDILDAMIEVAKDATHKDFAPTARVLIEHDLGKPKQSVEMSGKDGGALKLVITQDDAGVL